MAPVGNPGALAPALEQANVLKVDLEVSAACQRRDAARGGALSPRCTDRAELCRQQAVAGQLGVEAQLGGLDHGCWRCRVPGDGSMVPPAAGGARVNPGHAAVALARAESGRAAERAGLSIDGLRLPRA